MIRLLVFLTLLAMLVAGVVFLLMFVFFLLAMACAVGLPLWFLWHRQRQGSLPFSPQSRIDRLKALYVEGKIDLFEFERQVANLITVDS